MGVYQFRIFGNNNSKNYPNTSGLEAWPNGLCDNNALDAINDIIVNTIGDSAQIVRIGIQTIPGIEFIIDGKPIIVGNSGIMDIDIEDFGTISSIKFSYDSLKLIDDNPLAYLLLDIVTSGGESS